MRQVPRCRFEVIAYYWYGAGLVRVARFDQHVQRSRFAVEEELGGQHPTADDVVEGLATGFEGRCVRDGI